MKFLIVSLALVAAVAADVSHLVHKDSTAEVLRSVADVGPESYQYAYETSNNIAAQEQGVLKAVSGQEAAISVTGNNRYISPEGQVVETVYTADENGYQPQGSHIPTSPPIPEAILRSLEYIRVNGEKVAPVVYKVQAAPQFAGVLPVRRF